MLACLRYAFGTTKRQLVLLRHGQSTWQSANKWTGWTDVRLSAKGINDAIQAGKILQQNSYRFQCLYTSLLSRTIQTMHYICDELDLLHLPIHKEWRLNQRHYGALQGLNRAEIAQKYGKQQVQIWRRSYGVRPPPLSPEDPQHPIHNFKYSNVDSNLLPSSERYDKVVQSLKDVVDRVTPLWQKEILPNIVLGKPTLIVTHGNTMRSFIKILDQPTDQQLFETNIPTTTPLVYQFDDAGRAVRHFYLADPEELKQKMESVKNQPNKK